MSNPYRRNRHGSRCEPFLASRRAAPRKGVTLLELLTALSIMVMVVGTLGAIARAVQLGFEYNEGRGAATQHARVALERITRMAREATANEQFPGFIVLADEVGPWRFPDTLVIWHPERTEENPQGWPRDDDGNPHPVGPDDLPRYDELLIYCPGTADSTAPNDLVRIRLENDSRRLQPVEDETDWRPDIESIKESDAREEVVLTNLLRTGALAGAGDGQLRGAVRFESLLRPSSEQWKSADPWEELPWVQGTYGPQAGLRQAWLRIELELMTGEAPADGAVERRQAIPFFGSAALYYVMHKGQR